jgi:hypothetical protein
MNLEQMRQYIEKKILRELTLEEFSIAFLNEHFVKALGHTDEYFKLATQLSRSENILPAQIEAIAENYFNDPKNIDSYFENPETDFHKLFADKMHEDGIDPWQLLPMDLIEKIESPKARQNFASDSFRIQRYGIWLSAKARGTPLWLQEEPAFKQTLKVDFFGLTPVDLENFCVESLSHFLTTNDPLISKMRADTNPSNYINIPAFQELNPSMDPEGVEKIHKEPVDAMAGSLCRDTVRAVGFRPD